MRAGVITFAQVSTADTGDGLIGNATHRGYTEHEHLDEVGVIHMNGRVYDPLLGRMMSADPFIQAPSDLQSYNRYAYVMNNPLALTDPSGYLFGDLKGGRWVNVAKTAIVIYVAYQTGQWASGMYTNAAAGSILAGGSAWTIPGMTIGGTSAVIGGAAAGFAGSFTGTAMAGGNLEQATKAGFYGGIVGGAMGGVTQYTNGWDSVSKVSARAAESGFIAHTQGGNWCDAVRRTVITGTAAEMYTKFVGWDADAKPGENQPVNGTSVGKIGSNEYKFDGEKIPQNWQHRNVIGFNASINEAETGWFTGAQSGGISRALNVMPGMNAVAQFHDTIFSPSGPAFTVFNNISTMIPAAAITYMAIYDKLPYMDSKTCPMCVKR